jgi:hypothetical protein
LNLGFIIPKADSSKQKANFNNFDSTFIGRHGDQSLLKAFKIGATEFLEMIVRSILWSGRRGDQKKLVNLVCIFISTE